MLEQPSHTQNPHYDSQNKHTADTTKMRMHTSNNIHPNILQNRNIPYQGINTEITRQSLSRQLSNTVTPRTRQTNVNQTDLDMFLGQNSPLPSPFTDAIDSELKTEMNELNFYFTDVITPQSQMQFNDAEIANLSQLCIAQISNNNTAFSFSQSPSKSPSLNNGKKPNKKRKNKSRKRQKKTLGIGYAPNSAKRAQGNIQISKSMTENIIPSQIKESISNIYGFMDQSSCLSVSNHSQNDCAHIRIISYDFHHRTTNQRLYCVILRQDITSNKSRGYKWKMLNKLFTAHEIEKQYQIKAESLPLTFRSTKAYTNALLNGDRIKHKLRDRNTVLSIISECQWHKIPIFNRVNNKRRMTLSLTKPEFMKQCSQFVHCSVANAINLIPILMFDSELSNVYWIEYVWLINIDENISVGISFKFGPQNGIKVSGIHLDKQYLLAQHQLVLPSHKCHCFHSFHSNISDLNIGNPDDLQNKINYYRQVIDELTEYKENVKTYLNTMNIPTISPQTISNKTAVTNNNHLSQVQSPRYRHISYGNSNVWHGVSPMNNSVRSPVYTGNTNQFV